MQVTVNDLPREVPAGITVAELLARLELNVRHVAVELNTQLIPRARHGEQPLCEGDRLEVVTLVGGG